MIAPRCDGYLLAGGRSSRMGRDKALLELDGLPFAERIARAMRAAVGRLRVVGRDAVGEVHGVPDLRPGLGPLAGLEAALADCEGDAALVVACDMPFVTEAFLRLLIGRAAQAPGSAVVPEDAGGRRAPLCGVYPRAALPLVTGLLDAGERRPRALLDRMPTVLVAFAEYRSLPGAERLTRNVNTPAEYAALLGGGPEGGDG